MSNVIETDRLYAKQLIENAQKERACFFKLKDSEIESSLKSCHRYVLAMTQPISLFGVMNDAQLNKALFDLGAKYKLEIPNQSRKPFSATVAVSTLYDIGGHTRCVEFLVTHLKEYKWEIVESAYDGISQKKASKILSKIAPMASFLSFSWQKSWIEQARSIAERIITSGASKLVLFTHPDDLVWPIVLGMLKKNYPEIETVFFDHADHRFALSRNLCDSYVCFREFSLDQAKKAGALKRFVIPLVASIPSQETLSKLNLFRLPKHYTFSAAYTSKLMLDPELTFFELVAKGLKENIDYFHIQMTSFSSKEKRRIEKIFIKNSVSLTRLVCIPNTSDWHRFIKGCDVVLNSYPLGGGLIMQDVASSGKPTLAYCPEKDIGWQLLSDCPKAKTWMASDEKTWLKKLSNLLNQPERVAKQTKEIHLFHDPLRIEGLWRDLLNNHLSPREDTPLSWPEDTHGLRGVSLTSYHGAQWLYSCLYHPYSSSSLISKTSWISRFPLAIAFSWFNEKFIKKSLFGRLKESLSKRLRLFKCNSYPKYNLKLKCFLLPITSLLPWKSKKAKNKRIKLFNVPITNSIEYAKSHGITTHEILPPLTITLPKAHFFNEGLDQPKAGLSIQMPAHIRCCLKNVIIFGSSQMILSKDWQIIYDELHDPNLFIVKSFAVREYHKDGIDPLIQLQDVTIKEAIHLSVDFGKNYFHWLTEAAPRLIGILNQPELDHLPLLIDADLPFQTMEALRLLVGPDRKLIILEAHKAYFVKKLHYPNPVNFEREPRGNLCSAEDDCWMRPESFEFVRNKVLDYYSITPSPKRRFFVYRKAGARSAINLEEAKRVAISCGFEPLETSTMSFEEQARLFSTAKSVFFQSGAAFTNILFVPTSCKIGVTMVRSENINYSLLQFLPQYLGMQAKYLLCNPIVSTHWLPWHRSYLIDLQEFEKALKEMG